MNNLKVHSSVGLFAVRNFKVDIVKKTDDFALICKKGRKFVGKNLICYVLEEDFPVNSDVVIVPESNVYSSLNAGFTLLSSVRLGVSASKKIGNAVARVRAKRVLRAGFLEAFSKIAGNLNVFANVNKSEQTAQNPLQMHSKRLSFVLVARDGACDCKSYHIKSFLEYKVFSQIFGIL
jgi:ribonuclease P protein component